MIILVMSQIILGVVVMKNTDNVINEAQRAFDNIWKHREQINQKAVIEIFEKRVCIQQQQKSIIK